MIAEYVYIDLIFNYKMLGERMYKWRSENGLRQVDCDELIGMGASWSEYERRRHWPVDTKFEAHITVRTLLNIINLIDMSYDDVQTLFVLEKGSENE